MVVNNIRTATEQDVDSIKAIQDSWKYDPSKGWNTNAEEGFLIGMMDTPEIQEFLKRQDQYLLVYDRGEGIEGYLAAYDRERWAQRDPNLSLVDYNGPLVNVLKYYPYLYGRHIAKRKGVSGKVAVDLEEAFFELAREKGLSWVVAEVAYAPYNKKSYEFNKRLGWEGIARNYHDGAIWCVICKHLDNSPLWPGDGEPPPWWREQK